MTMTSPSDRGRGVRRLAHVAFAAMAIGAAAAPAVVAASDTAPTTVEVTMQCETFTHCSGTLADGALLDCLALDGRWTCRTNDGQIADVESSELNRQLTDVSATDPTEGKPVIPKVKVKATIRVRPTGG